MTIDDAWGKRRRIKKQSALSKMYGDNNEVSESLTAKNWLDAQQQQEGHLCLQLERHIVNRRIAYLIYPSPSTAIGGKVDLSAGVFYRRQRLINDNIRIGKK